MKYKIAQFIETIKLTGPLIPCITNTVVSNFNANILLALGASPIMSESPQEITEIIKKSSSLVINTGTINDQQFELMKIAVKAANLNNIPWILDPVGAGATTYRMKKNIFLLNQKPAIIKGNSSEISALFTTNLSGKGVDADINIDKVTQLAIDSAQKYMTTIAITGEVDLVTDGKILVHISNGHPLMGKITGTGCSAAALCGAFLSAAPSAVLAAISGLACMGIAGELAAQFCIGPGQMMPQLLDQIFFLNREKIDRYLKIQSKKIAYDTLSEVL